MFIVKIRRMHKFPLLAKCEFRFTTSGGKHSSRIDVLLTVHLSIFISVFNQLDVQNLYMFRAHVLETCKGMK